MSFKRKVLRGSLNVTLASTLVLGGLAIPASADQISDYSTRMVNLYNNMSDGASILANVRSHIVKNTSGTATEYVLQDSSIHQWNEILGTTLYGQLQQKLDHANTGKTVDQIMSSLVDILYSGNNDGNLDGKIRDFQSTYSAAFDAIFPSASGNSFNLFMNYLSEFETQLKSLNNLILLPTSENDYIRAAANAAAVNTGLDNVLTTDLGINIGNLLDIKDRMNTIVDPNGTLTNALISAAIATKNPVIQKADGTTLNTLTFDNSSSTVDLKVTLGTTTPIPLTAISHWTAYIHGTDTVAPFVTFTGGNRMSVSNDGTIDLVATIQGTQIVLARANNISINYKGNDASGGGSGSGGGVTPTPTPNPSTPSKSVDDAVGKISDVLKNTGSDASKASEIKDALESVVNTVQTAKDESSTVTATQGASKLASGVATALSNLSDKNARQQVVQSLTDVISTIGQGLTQNIKSQDKAIDAVSNAADVVKSVNQVLDQSKTGAEKEAVIKSVDKLVVGTQTAIEKITDSSKAQEAFNSIVQNVGQAVTKAGNVDGTAQVKNSMAKLAEAIISKASTETLSADKVAVDGTKATAAIDNDTVTKSIEKALAAQQSVQETLKQNGLNGEVKASVVIELPQVAVSVQSVKAQLSLSSFQTLKDRGISEVTVKLGNGISSTLSVDSLLNGATVAKAAVKTAALSDDVEISATKSEQAVQAGWSVASVGVPVYTVSAKVKGVDVSKFSQAVQLNIDVPSLKDGTNTEKLAVYQLVNGNWAAVGGKYDFGKNAVTFSTKKLGQFTVFLSNKTFDDLSPVKSWAQNPIEVMAAKGVIHGRSAGQFAPNANVTRAEFVKLIVQTLGLADDSVSVNYKDVSSKDWFYQDVAVATKLGIVAGTGNSTFKPNAPITRQEMATMAAQALKVAKGYYVTNPSEKLSQFADAGQIQPWAIESAALVVNKGIIRGVTDNSFDPKGVATRAQAAVIMYQIFNLD